MKDKNTQLYCEAGPSYRGIWRKPVNVQTTRVNAQHRHLRQHLTVMRSLMR